MKYIFILLGFFILTYSQAANCITKDDQNIEKVYLYTNQSQLFNLRNYFEGYNLQFSADGIENSYKLHQYLQQNDIQTINATQNYTLLDLDIFTDDNLAWGHRASSLGYISSDASYYIRYGTLNDKMNFVINNQVKIDTSDSHVCFDVVTATDRSIVLDCHNAQTKTDYIYLFDQFQNKTTKYTWNNSIATMKRKTLPYKINGKVYLLLAWIGNKMVNQQDRYNSFIQIFELNSDNEPILVSTLNSNCFQVNDLSISDITVDVVGNIYVVDERGTLIQFSFNGENITIRNKKNFNITLSKVSVHITQNLYHIVQVVGQHYIYQINIDTNSEAYNYLLPNINASDVIDFQTSSNLLILQTDKYYYVYKRHQTNLNKMLLTLQSNQSVFMLAPRTPNLLILGLNQSKSFMTSPDGYFIVNNNNIVNQTITVTATSYIANKTNSTSCSAQFILTLVDSDPKIWPKKDFNNTVTAQNPAYEVYRLDDYFAGSKLTYSTEAHLGVTLNLQTVSDVTIDSDIPFSTIVEFFATFTYDISSYYRVFISQKTLFIQNCKYNGDNNVNCVVFKKLNFQDKILYYQFFKTTIEDKTNIPILSYVSQQKQGQVNFIQLNSDKIFAPLQTSPEYVISDIDANERYVYVTVKNARRIYVFHNNLSNETYLLDFIISEDQIPFEQTIFYPRQTILSPTDINILIIRNLNSIIIMKITVFTQQFISEIIIDELSSSNSKIVMGKNSLLVMISGNSNGDEIRQYGGLNIYNPTEMRRIDIGNKKFVKPLNAFTIGDGTLVAIKTFQPNGLQFLTLIKTNQPKISSILTEIVIDSNIKVTMSELQNSCILEISNQANNFKLNKLMHTLLTTKYYYQPMLIARASLHNKFKDTFSFDITVTSPNYILPGTRIINVYDIKSKIDPSQLNPQIIQFPKNANEDEIQKQIPLDKYFNGPIAKYSIKCPYCGNEIKLSDHVTQITSRPQIPSSKAFHYFQHQQLMWTLTDNKIEVLNTNLQIVNSIDFSQNQTNFETLNWYVDNDSNVWILLTNVSDGNQFFIKSTLSGNKQNAQFSNLIIINKNPGIKNAQVIKFINNKFFVHDITLDDLKIGVVHVLEIKQIDSKYQITFLNTIDQTIFGYQTDLGINDFELISLTQNTSFFLSTLGNLGLAYFTFNTFNSQIKPRIYNLSSSDIIQSKLISIRNFLQLEIIQFNIDASFINLKTIITIENGQHQLIQLSFKNTEDSFIFESISGITVFGKYGKQTVLNWASTIINNGNNNALLIAHQGTNNKVSLGFYDLDYSDAQHTQQMFGAIEIDAQTKLSSNFAAILFKDEAYLKVVQSTKKDINSLFSVFNVSKTVSITYKYSEPGDFKNITFIASNQYGSTPIDIPVDFDSSHKKGGLAWYIILSIVLGGVILIGIGVFIGIKYRKKAATKDSLLTVKNDDQD